MSRNHQSRPSTSVGLLRMLLPSSPFLPFGRESPDTSPKFVIGPSSLGTRSTFDLEGHVPRHPTVSPAEAVVPNIDATPFLGSTIPSHTQPSSPTRITHSRSSSNQRSTFQTPRRFPVARRRLVDDDDPELIEVLSSPTRSYDVRHAPTRGSMEAEYYDTSPTVQRSSSVRQNPLQGEAPMISSPFDDLKPAHSPAPALRPLSTISQFRFEHPLLLPPDVPPLPPLQTPLHGPGLKVITAVSPAAIIGDARQLASPEESIHRQSHVAEMGSIPAPPSAPQPTILAPGGEQRTATPVPQRPPRSVHRLTPLPISPNDNSDQLIPPNLNLESRSSSMYHSSNHSNTSLSSAQIILAQRASASSVTVSTISWLNGPGVLPLPDENQAESSRLNPQHALQPSSPPPRPSTSSHDPDSPPPAVPTRRQQNFPNQSTTSFLASSLYTQSTNHSTVSLSAKRVPLHKRLLRPKSRAQIPKPNVLDTIPDAPTVASIRSLRRNPPDSHIQAQNPTSVPETSGTTRTGTTKRGRPGTALPKIQKSVDILRNLARPSTAAASQSPPGKVADKASRVLGLGVASPEVETTRLKLTPAWLSPGARNEDDFLTIPGEEYEYLDPVARDERKKEVRIGGYRGRKVSMKPEVVVSEVDKVEEKGIKDTPRSEVKEDESGPDPLATIRKTPHARPGLYDLVADPSGEGSSHRGGHRGKHDRSDSRLSITPHNLPSSHNGSSSPTSSPDPLTPTPPPANLPPVQTVNSTRSLPRSPFPSSAKIPLRHKRPMTAQPLHIPDTIDTPRKAGKFSLDMHRTAEAGPSRLLPAPAEMRAVKFGESAKRYSGRRSIDGLTGGGFMGRPSTSPSFNPRASEPNMRYDMASGNSDTGGANAIFSTRAFTRSSTSLSVVRRSNLLDVEYRAGWEPVEGHAGSSSSVPAPTRPLPVIPSSPAFELALSNVPEKLRADVKEYIMKDRAEKAAIWGQEEERSRVLGKPFGRVRWAGRCTKKAVKEGMKKVPFL